MIKQLALFSKTVGRTLFIFKSSYLANSEPGWKGLVLQEALSMCRQYTKTRASAMLA